MVLKSAFSIFAMLKSELGILILFLGAAGGYFNSWQKSRGKEVGGSLWKWERTLLVNATIAPNLDR